MDDDDCEHGKVGHGGDDYEGEVVQGHLDFLESSHARRKRTTAAAMKMPENRNIEAMSIGRIGTSTLSVLETVLVIVVVVPLMVVVEVRLQPSYLS